MYYAKKIGKNRWKVMFNLFLLYSHFKIRNNFFPTQTVMLHIGKIFPEFCLHCWWNGGGLCDNIHHREMSKLGCTFALPIPRLHYLWTKWKSKNSANIELQLKMVRLTATFLKYKKKNFQSIWTNLFPSRKLTFF